MSTVCLANYLNILVHVNLVIHLLFYCVSPYDLNTNLSTRLMHPVVQFTVMFQNPTYFSGCIILVQPGTRQEPL